MASVGETAIITGQHGRRLIYTMGMRACGQALVNMARSGEHDGALTRKYATAIKDSAEVIAEDVRDNAAVNTGHFRDSVKIVGGRSGASLRSTDSGAGPIDFASPGDNTTPGKWPFNLKAPGGYGEVLSIKYGAPSRFFFPAIDRHIDEVADKTAAVVAETFDELADRNWSRFRD